MIFQELPLLTSNPDGSFQKDYLSNSESAISSIPWQTILVESHWMVCRGRLHMETGAAHQELCLPIE